MFQGYYTVIWKPSTINWLKVNTDCSVLNLHASCGCDHRGSFMGCFASTLATMSIFLSLN